MKPSISQLQEVVERMDCASQSAFNRIELLASLALRSMENPKTYERVEDIAEAFVAIKGIAQEGMNDINVMAEEVGGNFVDAQGRTRSRAVAGAARKARGLQTAAEVAQ